MKHCLICPITFSTAVYREYTIHVISHVAAKLVDSSYFVNEKTTSSYWYCQICGFRFSDRDKVQDHLMEQHKDLLQYCTKPFCKIKMNESGDIAFTKEYLDMSLKKLLASFCTADPENPPDSELKEYTWGKDNYHNYFTNIETELCPICLTGLHLRPFSPISKCGHHLHSRCLKGLVDSGGRNCPVCRAEFSKYEGSNYDSPNDPVFVL